MAARGPFRGRASVLAVSVVLLTCLPLLSFADNTVNAFLPPIGYPWPAVHSGTKCQITWGGNTGQNKYHWIQEARLKVNGELTFDKTWPPPDEMPYNTSVQGIFVFDSTHFQDGTTLTFELTVIDNLGNTAVTTAIATTYNKGYDLVNQTLTGGPGETGAIVGLELSTQANHFLLAASNHNKPTILGDLPYYTVFFIYTHGATAEFGDCFVNGPPGVGSIVSAQDVVNAVSQKGQLPPFWYVHIQACSVFAGGDTRMASAFGIFPYSIDRAILSWSENMAYGGSNENYVQDLWGALCSQGDTLDEAIDVANAGQQTHGGDGCWVELLQHKIPPTIVGDLCMKIHAVYGGVGLQWWLQP